MPNFGKFRKSRKDNIEASESSTSIPALTENVAAEPPGSPIVVTRDHHSISRSRIDSDALKVMYRLNNAGFRAFLVGGAVRDLLLDKTPKDFDLGTDATPNDVRKLFRNSRIIGRRFKINHIYFRGGKIIEVATFRALHDHDEEDQEGEGLLMVQSDNTYGTAETDALRRDLTINGLFYDLKTFSVIDYVGGIEDLKNKVVRIIGDPVIRFREDPVRIIRAVRHAGRAGFSIEEKTLKGITELKDLLDECSTARLYEEMQKDLKSGSLKNVTLLFEKTGILGKIFPEIKNGLERADSKTRKRFLETLSQIDTVASKNEAVRPGILLAAMHMSLIDMQGAEPLDECVHECWSYWPESLVIEEGDEQDMLSADIEPGLEELKREELERQLTEVVQIVLGPLNVPRKEREHLVQVLRLRYLMIRHYFTPEDSLRLGRRDVIEDALLLLELTAHATGEEVYSFWKERASKGQGKGKKRSTKRRRRRRGKKQSSDE